MPKVEPKFCHHCHTKKDCALCDSSEGCAKSYCATCIEKYGTTMAEVLKQQQWKCFGCRNECLCTGCRKRGRSTAEPVVPSIHPKFAAWFQAMGIPGDSPLLQYTGPPPELASTTEASALAEQGLPQPLCPNLWAKPFVPARLNLASSAYRGVSSQGNRYRARICVDKIEYTICDAESEEEAARAYDLESLRFGKIRFLNFVYKGINDTVLPPGLEAALMASGKLPTSSAMFDSMGPPAMAHTPVGGTPLPSNGSPHYIGVSSRTGSKSKSRPAAQQAGSMGMGSSGRRAKGAPSLFSNGRGGSTSPAGFQGATPVFGSSGVWAMPKSKAYGPVGLPSGSTPLARAIMVYPAYPPPSGTSIGTQTALRPAQLPGLLHAQDVSDSDIVSDDGDGDGAGESGRSEGGLGEDEDEEARGRAGRGWPTQPRLAGASSQGYGLPRRESGVYEEELEERESKDEMYLHSTSSTPPSLLPSALPDLPQAGGKRKRSAYFRPQGASSSPIPAIAPSQVLAVLASEREQSGLEVKVARYTRLLSFLTRPDVRALLSDAQVRSAKRMILTGGEAILALLLSAVDSYEEQVEAAQDTHLQQHQPTGGQVGSSPALRLSAVAEEAGGLHLTLNEADDELDGMRIDHPAPPAPAPRASSSSYPISTVTAPHGGQAARMVAAGYELIDSLAATYKLWLDVGRLHGLVVAQDRGQPSSLPPLMPQVGMESDAQPAKGAGAAALDAPAAFPAGQVTMEDG